jgi:aldose 1-epimerase
MAEGRLTERRFGKSSVEPGVDVGEYTLVDERGVEVAVLTYGCILARVLAPDREGRRADVALGLSSLEAYETRNPFFGCVVGRYANRIGAARFALDGREYRIPTAQPPNALHGGIRGFDKHVWKVAREIAEGDAVGLELRHLSPDGDQGFPGNLDARVTYTLRGGELRIDYQATTDQTTVVNLTNHSYWNLRGEGEGSIQDHVVALAASHYTPVDEGLIPTGEVAPVAGTPFDFRQAKPIAEGLRSDHPQVALARGFDHNWVLDRADPPEADSLALAARVLEPVGGRTLEVLTTEPGVQFYTGNSLDGRVYGPSGRAYRQGDGFALETQHFPDSPNKPEFPSTVLRPGEVYRSTTVFRFGTDRG